MKKFLFPLDKVLRFKEETLEAKKNELAMLLLSLQELERQIDELNHQFSGINQNLSVSLQSGMSPFDLSVYKVYLNELNRRTKELLLEKQKLSEIIEPKKAAVVSLKGEISGIERLKEKQHKEYMYQEQKQFELEIEEFIAQTRCFAG